MQTYGMRSLYLTWQRWDKKPWLTTYRSIGCLSILQHIQRWAPWRTLSSPPNIKEGVEGGLLSKVWFSFYTRHVEVWTFVINNKALRWTYFPWPEVRFKFEVRLAKLASRSPVTIFWSPSGLVTNSIFFFVIGKTKIRCFSPNTQSRIPSVVQ